MQRRDEIRRHSPCRARASHGPGGSCRHLYTNAVVLFLQKHLLN